MAKKITETGPYSYRQLQRENAIQQDQLAEQSVFANMKPLYVPRSQTNDAIYEGQEQSPIMKQGTGDFFGNSVWDNRTITEDEWEKMQVNPNEQRAENQWTIAKYGAGILKGVGLAGTTFLDGTVGAIWGLAEGAIAAAKSDNLLDAGKNFFEASFNNSFSKELREVNQEMEEILPNYRTQDEIENPMALRNLFSANTIADDFLKNMGFTVGAFYSGNAYLGALKALGAGARMSTTAAKTIGSLVSGVNEGRIEAGNNYDEQIKAEMANLKPEYEKLYNQIMSEPDSLVMTDAGTAVSSRQLKLDSLQEKLKAAESDIRDRAANSAILTLAGNSIYLPFTDMYAYGKLYARGFKPKADLKGIVGKGTKNIDRTAEALEGQADRIIKDAEGYTFNKITNREAIGRGLKIVGSEGAEEMNQRFMASLSTNLYAPDSPDAYYNALTNDDYEANTKDFMTSLAEGFIDSWGNPEAYKEFIMGAVTGALGMPTFGKVNNSDASTYLGKGKTVGLSGGIFGEIGNANRQNQQGQQTVDSMNKFLKKINDTKEFFIRSQSFTDAMDGYLEEGDKFQYESAKDNDTFNTILAFSRAGRLQDFKDLVGDDFENLSDEQLKDIAQNTSSAENTWLNPDGSSMADTESGRQKMRQLLSQKRDNILSEIDSFEDALESVRAIGNNSLTDDQTSELAWLKWKQHKFEQRYNDVKESSSQFVDSLRESIDTFLGGKYKSILETEVETPVEDDPDYTREDYEKDTKLHYRLLESLDKGTITDKQRVQLQHVQERLAAHRQYEKPADTRTQKEREESANAGKKILDSMKVVREFLQAVKDSKSALQLGSLIKNNPEVVKYINDIGYNLLDGILDADYDTFTQNMEKISDTAKIAQAARDFNERYREFTEDPLKLIQNRQNIDSKKQQTTQATTQLNEVDNLRNAEVGDLAQQAREGNIDFDTMDDLLSQMENSEDRDNIQAKLDEAKDLNQAYDAIKDGIQNSVPEGNNIDPIVAQQAIDDAQTLLDAALQNANSVDELRDLDTEAWLDMRNLSASEPDVLEENLVQRFEEARKLAQQVIDKIKPVKSMRGKAAPIEGTGSTGHDAVDNTKTVNDQKKAAQKNSQDMQDRADLMTIYNYNKETLLSQIPFEERDLYAADFDSLIKDIEDLILLGKDSSTIGSTIGTRDNYKRIKARFPVIDNILNYFIQHHPTLRQNSASVSQQQQQQQQTVKPQLQRGVPTPDIQSVTVTEKSQPVIEKDAMQGGQYQYIRPWTSQLPFSNLSGEQKPYYQLLNKVGDKYVDPNGQEYTEEQYKRMKAVYEYLEQTGAFDRVNNGIVEPNTKIGFKIDEALNEEAGDTVILITVDDKVVGDLPPKSASASYAGLGKLIKDIENQYTKDKKITITATVDKNKVGKVLYDDTYKPLNNIVNGQPLVLGIAIEGNRIMIDGGRTKDNRGARDMVAMPAANATLGQPFIMFTTSDKRRKYIPVPIAMEPFQASNENTAIHQAVKTTIQHIMSRDARAEILKDDLLDLLALEDAFIEFKENNIKVRIKKIGEDWQTIYDGADSDNITQMLSKLYGVPYQISRKFINGQYKGQNYNQMIGQLATTNVPIGATHTVSDWFTIKAPNAKTDSGKSTRVNNHRSEGAFLTLNYDGHSYQMDTKNNFEVYDENRQVYHGEHENILKAHAWGLHHNLNVNSMWNTPWGNYNPKTGQFVVKQQKPSNDIFSDQGEGFLESLSEFTTYSKEMQEAIAQREQQQKESTWDKFYSSHPNIKTVDQNFAGYFEGGGKFITDDFPGFNEQLAKKYENYHLGTGEFTEQDAIEFLNEISRIQREKTQAAANPDVDQLNSEECTDKMIKAGLLNDNIKRALWSILSLESQRIISNKAGKPKARQWMDSLSKVFNTRTNSFDLNKLPNRPSTVEEYLNNKPKYSKKAKDIYEFWDQEKEIKWLKRVLPQLSNDELLRIHNGLIQISQEDGGGQAYGMFWQGVITIASNAIKGTLYHEAFHSVTNTLLTDEEYNDLFIAAKEKWGNLNPLELEEKMSEDFRQYVELEETPMLGTMVKIYRMLKHLVQNLLGTEPYINKIYYNISRGNYANRSQRRAEVIRYSEDSYPNKTLKDLQDIVDTTINNPAVYRNRVSRNKAWGDFKDNWETRGYIVKGYFNEKIKKWTVASVLFNPKFKKVSDNIIPQYYRDKLALGNLSEEDRQYLKDRKISEEEYNNMSYNEREVLLNCK